MEKPPSDQPPASATEPPPSSLAPSPEAEHTDQRELLFLLGLALGLLSILLAKVISIPTANGAIPGWVLPFLGLLIAAPPLIASKPQRFLGVGLLVGFLIAIPVSLALWVSVLCGPGPGC